jgi:hypothetical protein
MAKKVNSVALKGILDCDVMEVTEQTKEAEFTYDFLEVLREFDGKQVSIQIREEQELPVKDEE